MSTPDLSRLTLEQKASLLSGSDFWGTKELKEAGIPPLVLSDGPHGIRRQAGQSDHLGINDSLPSTCLPPAVAVGSSWNPDIAARVGEAVGREARAFGVAIALGPGVNIKRSPLCGRNFEYYSEDPLLSGVLGAAHVNAVQAVGTGASVKHFAANNQETERMRISADVDERTLREIYLPAFERVVTEANPATVMSSYNKINGVPASENPWLLTDVLRHEWGFQGAVVSDWGAVSDRVAGVKAGLDLEMPGRGPAIDQEVVDAVLSGDLDEAVVDASVRRVARLTDFAPEQGVTFDVDEHHALARELATEGIVLLRNENSALPLLAGQRIAVIGAFADTPRFQGGGSSHINPTRLDNALDAIHVHAQKMNSRVTFAQGFTLDGSGDEATLLTDAVTAASSADVAVVFVGLGEREESEGYDRDTMVLPPVQAVLLKAIAKEAPRTVVVLSNGGVVSLEGWHDDVDAIVEGWLLGQGGGQALADVLFGAANPSGHLAETIPLRLEDNLSYLNFPGEQGHVRYGEGVFVGYRYYESVNVPVRYPFGYGLSYTQFSTTGLTVDSNNVDEALASVTVKNTGDRAGKHVVQLYVSTNAGPVRRPVRELRAFAKVELQAGEERTVDFSLDRRAFAYWNVELGQWVVPAGTYLVQIGTDSSTVVAESAIELRGDVIARPLTMQSSVGDWLSHPVVGSVLMEGMAANMTPEQAQQAEQNPEGLKMVESMPMHQFLSFTGSVFPLEVLESLMEQTRTEAADSETVSA